MNSDNHGDLYRGYDVTHDEDELCEKCGDGLIFKRGKLICPRCDRKKLDKPKRPKGQQQVNW